MKKSILKLSAWPWNSLLSIARTTQRLLYSGNARFCPVCNNSSRKFRNFGEEQRKDAQCIHCRALERHRLLGLFLEKKSDLFNGKDKKMLHVAPEKCLEQRFRKQLGGNYFTADLLSPRVMLKMDVTNIPCHDQAFDVIYCSHVLEHVQDDKKAIREFFRVLKTDGWAILLVPITRDKTYEDSSITDPEERHRAFGQEDHARSYGRDYIDRLRQAGFTVEINTVSDLVTDRKEILAMGLTPASAALYPQVMVDIGFQDVYRSQHGNTKPNQADTNTT